MNPHFNKESWKRNTVTLKPTPFPEVWLKVNMETSAGHFPLDTRFLEPVTVRWPKAITRKRPPLIDCISNQGQTTAWR